jgi:hypothetical protein
VVGAPNHLFGIPPGGRTSDNVIRSDPIHGLLGVVLLVVGSKGSETADGLFEVDRGALSVRDPPRSRGRSVALMRPLA